jgi:hypothetical protein
MVKERVESCKKIYEDRQVGGNVNVHNYQHIRLMTEKSSLFGAFSAHLFSLFKVFIIQDCLPLAFPLQIFAAVMQQN